MVEDRPAGFWIRAVALALDFAIFSLVQASYGALAHLVWGTQVQDAWTLAPTVWTFTFVFAAVYTTVLHALFGQTIGKMIVGVHVVVGEDGAPPSFGVYAMAGLRHDKGALHDLIAGTRVERVSGPRVVDGSAEPSAEAPASMPSGSGTS